MERAAPPSFLPLPICASCLSKQEEPVGFPVGLSKVTHCPDVPRKLARLSQPTARMIAKSLFFCARGHSELSPIEWTGKSFNYAAISNSFL